MKKKSKIQRIILLLVIALGIGAGTYWYTQRESEPKSRLDLYGSVDIRQIQLAFHATGAHRKTLGSGRATW